MKRSFFSSLAIALLALTTGFATAQTFSYPVKGEKGFSLTEKTRGNVAISYNLGEFSFSSLNYKGEDMSEISIAALTLPNNAGCPNLPTESRFIAIPKGATAKLNVVSFEKEVIRNVNIAPALRIQAETEEPDMNYIKDEKVYAVNANYPADPFVVSTTTSLRGVDAVVVSITPFQYNPVTKELTVYSNVKLDLQFEGGSGEFGDNRLRSPYWDNILAAELMNYDQLPVIDYSARMQQWLRDDAEGAEYIIVTPNNDEWAPYANQLKEFRTKQGIITKVYRLDEMPANSTNELKAWFHDAYNNWEIAPVAVCLLGDHGSNMAQYIPAETVPHPYEGSCITDNGYADVTGDNLPDMVFSRLIAQNAAELPVFVGKQIEYEYTNVNMDPNFYTRPITALGWQTERWFQLCSEVFGGYMRSKGYDVNRINCIYDGNPGSIWSSAQNTNNVVSYFGPSGQSYIPQTPNELGGWNNGSPEQVVEAVNQGTFWLQHRDHGLETGWGEPAMRNSHVAQCNNVNKLPFVMSINCLTGKFNYNSDCFCEAWMRRTYNGENAGAVGLLCPTETSYSFVNDAFVWGVYDLFDSDFMPDFGPYADKSDNWMPAFGNVAGKYFLHQSSWPYNVEDKDITYTMFTAHCDAFLRIYTQVPEQMDITHPEVVLAGLSEVTITAPQGSTVSLVKENAEGEWEILAVAEGTGDPMNIEFPAQVPPTQIHIVATGQNYLRYEAVMDVIPADGPYIVFDSKVIHDENGNGQLDFGETISLDMTLKNVGSENMEAFTATVSTESLDITLINNTADYNSLAPNETQTLENAFTMKVGEDVSDNTNNIFTVTVVNGENSYVSTFGMRAYAPVFKVNDMSITEIEGNGNGRLDAGETAQLNFTFENKGHADAARTYAYVDMLSPYITFEEDEIIFETVAADETLTATYNITISEETPMGYTCPINFRVISNNNGDVKDFTVKVGLTIEDFETGELSEGWNNDLQNPWRIVSENPYEGIYCVRSGSISNNGNTQLSLRHEAGSDDEISFYYKVSSEANYDKMHFYIDGVEKGTWSGTVDWTQATYPVSAGTHTYKWSYTKDTSVSNGSDCCWIDYISLPSPKVMAGTAGPDVNTCVGNDAQIIGYAIYHDNLTWTTAGDGTFNDATIATPLYTPGPQDLEARSVVLTVTITGQGETITDDMTVNILENVTLEAPLDASMCLNGEPQEVTITIEGDYQSFTWRTFGDGEFESPNEVNTFYTPGPQDIENGYVQMLADAESMGCGHVTEEVYYMLCVPPQITIQENSTDICEGEYAYMDVILSGTTYMHGGYTITTEDGNTISVDSPGINTIPLGILPVGETVFNFTGLASPYCYTGYELGERTFTVNVHAQPTLEVANTEQTICEGETATFDMSLTGTAPFSISAEGMNDFTADANEFTLNLNPEESLNATLTKVTDGNGCETSLEIALNVNVIGETPLTFAGDINPDAYVTPTSTYSIVEDIPAVWSINPENAGTIVPADGGKSISITWTTGFKGEVTLIATPDLGCELESSTLEIFVKNSTSVNENMINATIFPNPTNGNVTIKADNMQRIIIANTLGQIVYDAEPDTNETILNMAQFGAGLFTIKVITANGIGTQQVTVVR